MSQINARIIEQSVQTALSQLGFYTGEIDGVFAERSQSAVAGLLQSQYGVGSERQEGQYNCFMPFEKLPNCMEWTEVDGYVVVKLKEAGGKSTSWETIQARKLEEQARQAEIARLKAEAEAKAAQEAVAVEAPVTPVVEAPAEVAVVTAEPEVVGDLNKDGHIDVLEEELLSEDEQLAQMMAEEEAQKATSTVTVDANTTVLEIDRTP